MKKHILPALPGEAGDCLNLRPATAGNSLVPVGAPVNLHSTPWRCVGIHPSPGGSPFHILHHGSVLAMASATVTEPFIITDDLSDTPTASLVTSRGFLVLTTGTSLNLEWDDGGLLRVVRGYSVNDYPAVESLTVDEVSLPCKSGQLKLSRDYTDLPEFPDPDDTRKIISHFATLCGSTARRAMLSGVFTAPVLFRYRLLDGNNRVIFTSVPTMHQPSGRHALAAPLTVMINDRQLEETTFGLEGYCIDVTIPPETSSAMRRRVARIELQLSPQLHIPLSDTLIVSQIRIAGTDTILSVDTPGYGAHPSLAASARDILSRPDDFFVTVRTLYDPLSATEATRIRLVPHHHAVGNLPSVSRSAATAGHSLLPLLAYHDWGATAGVNDTDRLLLANIHLTRYHGSPATHFINTGSTLDNIETAVTVTFQDGSRVTNNRYLRSNRDVCLSPVLCYPDPAARLIEIQLCDSAGNNRYASFPLTPVSSSMAAYIDPAMRPIKLSHTDDSPEYLVAPSTGGARCYPGTIVSLGLDGPLSATDIGPSEITSLQPVARASSSAWEASRSRFHVMAGSGIYSLSLNAGILQSPRPLDSRPVLRPDAVASLSTGNGTQLYTLAGDDLIMIESNRVTTVWHNTGAIMLCPVPRHGELVLIPANGTDEDSITATVLHVGNPGGWTTRTLPAVYRIFSNPLGTYLTAPLGTFTLDRETGDPVDCHYSREIQQKITHQLAGIPRLSYIIANIISDLATGDIDITGSQGDDHAMLLSRLTVDGPLVAPLCHHLLVPRRYRLWQVYNLTLSVNSKIYPDG